MPTWDDTHDGEDFPPVAAMLRNFYKLHPAFIPTRTPMERAAAVRDVMEKLLSHVPITLPRVLLALINRGICEIERKIGAELHRRQMDSVSDGGRKLREREQALSRSGVTITPDVRSSLVTQLALDFDAWFDEPAITPSGEVLPSRRHSLPSDTSVRNDTTHARILPDVERYFGDREAERQQVEYLRRTGTPLTLGELKEIGELDMTLVATAMQDARAMLVARLPE